MRTVAGLVLTLTVMGCEVGNNDGDPSRESTTVTTTSTASTEPAAEARSNPAPAVDGRDQLNISGAKSLGTHAGISAQNAAVTRTLYAANKEGDSVSLSFDNLGWPTRTDKGKKVDGGVWLFWVEGGQVVGGLFDFHGVGQTSKTLANVFEGYLSGKRPAPGQEIYFAIVSLDGSERTNVAQSQSPW